MPYPTISASYGFRPVNLLGGQVYSGSTREIPIATAHGTSIFFGDVVVMSANGCVNNATLTATTVNVLGIFMGCSYLNSQSQRVYAQYFPALTAGTPDSASAILAYVVDDPDVVMKVAIQSAADAAPSASQATRAVMVGGNASIVYQTVKGSALSGNGTQGALNSTATTAALPLKVIDIVPDTATAAGSFVEVLVAWNQGIHHYRAALAI